MRKTSRRLLGAMVMLVLIASGQQAQSQDCPQCQGQASQKVGPAGPRGAIGCWDENGQPCRTRSPHWQRPYTESSQPDVFYNLYTPNNFGEAAAAYPAPLPTPNLVGHTYYTYQPFMPHEFLYHHHRTYHQYYNNGMGLNRTSVHWYGTPLRTAAKSVGDFFTLPR